MVNVTKVVKKGGKISGKAGSVIGELSSDFKKISRKGKKGSKVSKKTLDVMSESLEKTKKQSKKFTKAQYLAIIATGATATYAGVNLGEGVIEHNKRLNKLFDVTEVFYKDGDNKDEITFVISNPEKIEIYPTDEVVITYADIYYEQKIDNKTIKLNDQPYLISETKVNKDKENDELPKDTNLDVPFLITVTINGLDLTGKDNNMIKKGDKLFTLQLIPDFNNSIKNEFDDDSEKIKEAGESVFSSLTDPFVNLFGDIGDVIFWVIVGIVILLFIVFIFFIYNNLIKYRAK